MSKTGDFLSGLGGFLRDATKDLAQGASWATDTVRGKISRSSPEYVERIKSLRQKAGSAYRSALGRLEAHLDAEDARVAARDNPGFAERWMRNRGGTAAPTAQVAQPTAGEDVSVGDMARQAVANQLANVYWLRKAECKVTGAAFTANDLFFPDDEAMNRLIEEAIRAQEPKEDATPAQIDAQLAALEVNLPKPADAASEPEKE